MITIVDNFCPRIDEVRASALAAGFGTWRPSRGEVGSSVYEGMGFWGLHAPMVHALAYHVGRPVYPNAMFFRVTNRDTEAAYVHSDRESGDFTAIAYLSRHEERYGTGFYRHRETGLIEMPSFQALREDPEFFQRLKQQMVEGSEEHWELLDFVHGRYNKALIFSAPRFHARTPRHGFGETPEDGRLIWGCHFMLQQP